MTDIPLYYFKISEWMD